MPGTTPRIALPYPVASDSNNVPQDIQKLAAAFDLIGVVFAQGSLNARPAAATAGRFYAATDQSTPVVYYDTGTGWVLANGSLSSAFAAKGDVLAATGPAAPARVSVGVDSTSLVARASYAAGVGWEPVLGLPLGLTGATAATRFAGGTVTGAPTTGTFAVGDVVISQDGNRWVCTTAGAPGTFAQIGGVGSQVVQAASVASAVGGVGSPTPQGDTSAVATTAVVSVTNPSTTRSMLVRANLQGFLSWANDNGGPAVDIAWSNVDLKQGGVSIDPGRTAQQNSESITYYLRDLNATSVIIPPSGSVNFQGVATATITPYSSTSVAFSLTAKAYLNVVGWTL